jgi:hypothetical protein
MAPPWYRYIDFSYVTHYSGRADGTIVPWNDDTAGTRRLYDFVAAGYVYRDSVDRVILAAYGDRQYVLRGAAVEEVDSVERYATVAIERRIDVATGATEYWAIEVRYAAPRSSGS